MDPTKQSSKLGFIDYHKLKEIYGQEEALRLLKILWENLPSNISFKDLAFSLGVSFNTLANWIEKWKIEEKRFKRKINRLKKLSQEISNKS